MPAISLSGQTRQRQIVLLAVGGVLLGGLLLFQVPRTLEMLKSDAPPAPPAEQTATTPVTPGTPPASPVVPVSTTPSTARLTSLTRFKSKDPFVPQINANAGSSATSPTGSSAPAPSESTSEPAPSTVVESASQTSTTPDTATIAVNGVDQSVRVASTFPEDNPVFRLMSYDGDTAKVAIAGGSLRGGSPTVTLGRGEPLTLLNTVDGKRYRLELK